VFWQLVNYMFSNTAQTQHKVLHSISHSALYVLNILVGKGYIKEWWPCFVRIIYTFLKLHLPECMQPKQSLAPPPTNTVHSPNTSEWPKDSVLLPPGTCYTNLHDCRPQHLSVPSVISSKRFKTLCHFMSKTSY